MIIIVIINQLTIVMIVIYNNDELTMRSGLNNREVKKKTVFCVVQILWSA